MNKGKRLVGLTVSVCILVMTVGCGVGDSICSTATDKLGQLVVGEPKQVESISTEKIAYQSLADQEKNVYDQVLDCILNHEEKVAVDTKDKEVLAKAVNCVMADYGGLFWVSGYQYNTYTSGDTVLGLEYMPKYTMTQEERETAQKKVDQVVTEWLSGISMDAGDYEKSKYVYDTLIQKVDYVKGSENNQNILSVFLNQKTVCQGYADATMYMLGQLGIPSSIVTGQANGESHAWNLVQLDGNYYFMDTTWGNSRYLDTNSSEQKTINYAYLNVTSEEMSATHMVETDYTVPECIATEDNYFIKEGCYFSQWNPDDIGNVLKKAWDAGEKSVTIRMSDGDLYDRMMDYFIGNQHIINYCNGIRTIHYLEDQPSHVVVFHLNDE